MKRIYPILFVLLCVALLCSCGDSSNDQTTNTLPEGAELQAVMDNAVSDDGVPGAVMAVETPEGTWIGAAGKAALATGRAMTVDTQVRIASITKPLTATLIMKLVEDGNLKLGDTVEYWLPGALPRYGDQITVLMLLNHTSGIPDHENTREWRDRLLAHPTAFWTSEDILAILRIHEAEFVQPGTVYEYCNTGYYLLGMIAEAATGDTVANETDRRFFYPLNMGRTALTRDGMKTDPYAHDYCWAEDELLDTSGWNMSWDWTAGSAVTIAWDMLLWTRAFFGGKSGEHGDAGADGNPHSPSNGIWLRAPDKKGMARRFRGKSNQPFRSERWCVHAMALFPGIKAHYFRGFEPAGFLRTALGGLRRDHVVYHLRCS